MASGAKKRRKSQSPARITASKRARVISKRTQHDEPDPHSSRAGSVKDTHLAQKQGRSTSLPIGDDWVFRVKVISSATDLGNELFKNAVQGLVRICFPEGILDQLGPQVLEQHMREEKAPEKNIKKMSEIFRAEMEQRMASMLAEFLDTAAKVDSILKIVLSASARAHGDNLGGDILGHVTASLLKLKSRASDHSTEWLAGSDAAVEEEEDDGSDGDSSSSDISDKEPTPPPKAKKHKKRDRKARRVRSMTPEDILEDAEVDDALPATLPEQHTSKNKDRKISSKWQWDVDAAELADEDVAEAFPRTSDLFAYHALPISRRKLGPNASKKEIRCEMQSLLDGLSAQEFQKWVESLQKLLNGDREMLDRPELSPSGDRQQLNRINPAPVAMRKEDRRTTVASVGEHTQSDLRASHTPKPSFNDVAIKHEGAQLLHPTAQPRAEVFSGRLARTTAILRQLSTEEQEFWSPVANGDVASKGRNADLGKDQSGFVSGFRMPILNLLYGSDTFTHDNCLKDGMKITRIIMANLGNRMKDERIGVKGLDGATSTLTKDELRSAIFSKFPSRPERSFQFMQVKKEIETCLIPWVIAEPNAFPELKAMPFVFSNIDPSMPTIITLLFGSWQAVAGRTAFEMWTLLVQVVKERGLSEASIGAAGIDFVQLDKIMTDKKPGIARRVPVERLLRQLVFEHRKVFWTLKKSVVVQAWELKTGLTW